MPILRGTTHKSNSFAVQGRLAAKCLLGAGWMVACLTGQGHALDNELASAPHETAEKEPDSARMASLRGTNAVRPKRRRYDYSRFSNGPRWVPRPRGASLKRAESLGLGTFEAAKALLRKPPAEPLLSAAGTENPRRLLWPVVAGRWGRGFGYTRKHRKDLRHNGVDIVAPEGAAVRAAASGIVAYSDNGLRGLGNAVLIVHPNGWCTLYAHNLRNTVQAGWRVKRGERIALVGSTGISWGPHLHFEFRDRGRLRNPARLFEGVRSLGLNGPLVELQRQDGPKKGDPSQRASAKAVGKGSREERRTAPAAAHAGRVATRGADALPGATSCLALGDAAAGAVARAQNSSRSRGPGASDSQRAEPESGQCQGLALGTVEVARAFLSRGPSERELHAVPGRLFRNLLWPVRGGRLARPFRAHRHPGVDIEAEEGAGVRAAADGLVVYSGDGLDGYGNAVVLLHPNGWVTAYGSNRENAVKAGDVVLRGAWIGRVGSTGSAQGPHLHFELLQGGERRDPAPLFANAPAAF